MCVVSVYTRNLEIYPVDGLCQYVLLVVDILHIHVNRRKIVDHLVSDGVSQVFLVVHGLIIIPVCIAAIGEYTANSVTPRWRRYREVAAAETYVYSAYQVAGPGHLHGLGHHHTFTRSEKGIGVIGFTISRQYASPAI